MGLITSFALAVLAAVLIAVARILYNRLTRISIAYIRGPEPESFALGNLPAFIQSPAGDMDFKWIERYGDVVRFKGPFGEDRLLIADPKAIQYVYQTAGYRFPKQAERREAAFLFTGRGLLWADGANHRRQRKVMIPAFRSRESRSFVPIFNATAAKLCNKWKDVIGSAPGSSGVVNVAQWIARGSLDAIGQAAFDYKFNSLDHADSELERAFSNLCLTVFGSLTRKEIFRQVLAPYIPATVRNFIVGITRDRRVRRLVAASDISTAVAKSLVGIKTDALTHGSGNTDVMSLMVHANLSESQSGRMSEEELVSQMKGLMLAGYETTATALTWALLEIARRPDVQSRLRREIRQKAREIAARGDSGFTANDFDDMEYLTAVIKESLRFHPSTPSTYREAARDDVLPLSKPIITANGEEINEIPIPKGQKIVTSINGYNRHKDIFGADSHVYDPDRWMEPDRIEKSMPVGVYGNLLSFAGGVRSCIGWRFAILEMQSFIVEMINNFEFSPTPVTEKVRREACLIMAPIIEGELEKGSQLPLKMRVISPTEDW